MSSAAAPTADCKLWRPGPCGWPPGVLFPLSPAGYSEGRPCPDGGAPTPDGDDRAGMEGCAWGDFGWEDQWDFCEDATALDDWGESGGCGLNGEIRGVGGPERSGPSHPALPETVAGGPEIGDAGTIFLSAPGAPEDDGREAIEAILLMDDAALRSLYACAWGDTQSNFCARFACDQSNFGEWLRGRKMSRASETAVKKFCISLFCGGGGSCASRSWWDLYEKIAGPGLAAVHYIDHSASHMPDASCTVCVFGSGRAAHFSHRVSEWVAAIPEGGGTRNIAALIYFMILCHHDVLALRPEVAFYVYGRKDSRREFGALAVSIGRRIEYARIPET